MGICAGPNPARRKCRPAVKGGAHQNDTTVRCVPRARRVGGLPLSFGKGTLLRATWSRFREFWTAEEVPRWIGLSLIGILLFGLGAASYRGVSDTRERFANRARRSNTQAVELLALTLARTDPADATAVQRGLRDFARWHRCERLRVINPEGIVIASISLDEVGHPDDYRPGIELVSPTQRVSASLSPGATGLDRHLVMCPIERSRETTGVGDSLSPDYLQGVLLAQLDAGLMDGRVGIAIVVCVVVAMFFLVYRAMRRHFLSMSLISENLLQRGDQIEQDLQAMRLADSDNALTVQWNRLIDLVADLSENARRATASDELKEVLIKSRKGAMADVINALPDGLLYVVDKQRLAFANAAARRLLETDPPEDETPALDGLQFGATGDRIIEEIRQTLGPDGNYRPVSTVVAADGASGDYRVRVLPFNARRKTGECIVTIADISQQVRSDLALQEFVAQLAHELRTPLTNIQAYAETLSSGVFDDPKIISDCYNVITKETRRLSRLIEDILSVSQMEVGSIRLQVNDVDLRALLSDSVRDLRGLADESQIDMQLSLPSKLPTLRGDRDKLAVVINNLLGNALKYTPADGSVHIGCKATDDEVLVTVKDTGMGIDPGDHGRIFEKFQRGSSEAVEEIVGTGLGLTTAREFVRGHGGDIEVMSAAGEGATFIVRLPLTAPQAVCGAQLN